jgi:Zn-dependent peptidase ImmA (M78 family)
MSAHQSDDREWQPDFDAEELVAAAKPRYALARSKAAALLAKYKITAPHVDVVALIAACSLTLKRLSIDSPFAGQMYGSKREIAVNTLERSDERQRFTMAHELGHWELAHYLTNDVPPDMQGYAGTFEDDVRSEGRNVVEIEANVFAAELLIPSAWIRKIPKGLSEGQPDRLAAKYVVSRQAMFYQLMHCGRF